MGLSAFPEILGPWRVLERAYANRISLTFHTGSLQDGYDGDRRIVDLEHVDALGVERGGFEYGYDRMDNRLFERRTHFPTNVRGDNAVYDSAYRIVSFEREVKAPDVGNPGGASFSERRDWTLDGVGNWAELEITTQLSTQNLTLTGRTDYK